MTINPLIKKYDLSRYTVYQMLEYVSATQDRKVAQEEKDGMYLIKTIPFLNELYNYAHILAGKLSPDDEQEMREFFADDKFRVKFPDNESLSQACSQFGYTFRDSSYGMISDINEDTDYTFELAPNLRIAKITSTSAFNECKAISTEAFDRAPGMVEYKI